MTTVLVPYNAGFRDLEPRHVDFQEQIFKRKKKAVLSELRCLTEVPKIVSTLKQGTVYKLVAAPEGAKHYKDAAGNMKGVFYQDGKIVEHARFSEIRPSLIKAAQSVGAQVLLVSIAMQLNDIEKSISRIIAELHNDRVAEICAGARQFEEAMLIKNADRQSRMIEHAVQTLHVGYEKTVRSLKVQIENAPDSKVGFFDNLLSDKSRKAGEMMALAEESFKASILGLRTLSECYAFLGEHDAARFSFDSHLDALKACGLESASDKAQMVEAIGGRYPEEIWEQFLKGEQSLRDKLGAYSDIAKKKFNTLEIEFEPSELEEVRHDPL